MVDNPVSMLFGWEAIFCAITASALTQLIKTIIDVVYQRKFGKAEGLKKRKGNVIITRLVLPMMPPLFGAAYAMLVPFIPETLITWFTSHEVDAWQRLLGLAVWGGACGQFSDYLYSKVRKLFEDTMSGGGS
jgi:hypothetical protein